MRQYGKNGEQVLDASPHNVYLIYYHLVLVTKYRAKMIYNDEVSDYLKEFLREYSSAFNVKVEEIETEADHVHLLLRTTPDINMSAYIKRLKGASAYSVRKRFPEIKTISSSHFWSRSFCLLSTGGAPIEIIKKYIESQGKK